MKLCVAYLRRAAAAGLVMASRLLVSCGVAALLATPMLPALAQQMFSFNQQQTNPLADMGTFARPVPGDKMLLEADELVYNFDSETVIARGNVKIYYGGYVLDADEVAYDQKSGRMIAAGGVRMLEPGGTLIVTDRLDITDDFRDGFVASLSVLATDGIRYTAQSAERRDGNLMIFRRGVYTACEPCEKHPNWPPLWQIKASRIIHDEARKMIYYRGAQIDVFGVPVAYVPVFFHPDPTVRRKSGLLPPTFVSSEAIGFGATVPFFWNLAPNYDVTFSPTLLTKQGLLMHTEWRHRLLNGSYSIRAAGIFQQDREVFAGLSGDRDFRGSVHSTGVFTLRPNWWLGWTLDATTDRTFNRDYLMLDANGTDLTDTLWLTGVSDTNFFNAAAYYYTVQRENTVETLAAGSYTHDDQREQPVVLPVIDHNYIVDDSVFGGQLRFDSNLTNLTREKSDVRHPPAPYPDYYTGIAGTFTRATSRASWQRRFVLPGGQLVTPFTYVQADANWIAADDAAAGLTSGGASGRVMPALGAEYEWPFLATLGPTVHTFGPKVQLIARPNEWHPGTLPNEDSQSLVFDDTSLFEWDKFSGYDRQEGGTRANVGFLYQGLFPNGATVDAMVGQSFQLAGENSFTLQDPALTGVGSGLETAESDYLARLTVNTGFGIGATARGRFDNEDFILNRGEISAVGAYRGSSFGVDYAFIRESPSSGVFTLRKEITASAALQILNNWSLFGSFTYDFAKQSDVLRSVGITFANDCTVLTASYQETTDPYTDLVSGRAVYLRVSLRTVAEQSFSRALPLPLQ